MKINSIYKVITSMAVLGSLTACLGLGSVDLTMGLGDEDESEHYYVIDVDRGAVANSFAKDRVLRIDPVNIAGSFRGQEIVFKIGENEYLPQNNHQFFSSPDDMFTEQLKRWLQKTGLFSQVIIGEGSEADMILETTVTALYGEQREQFSPQAVLEMQFFLSANNEQGSHALFQTALRIDIDIEQTTATNVVKGWNIGLEQLLATVEDDFRAYFSKRNP